MPRRARAGALGPREVQRLWIRVSPSIVGMIVMATVLLFIQHAFSPIVTRVVLLPWLLWMWTCILLFSLSVAALMVPRWRGGRSASFFIRVGQALASAFCLGIVVSVWILMPPADPSMRTLMLLLVMWFIAMVIILNPDAIAIYGALAVILSMSAFVIAYDLPYKWALAGFLVGEGAALIAIRRMIWRAADRLEAALAIVAAERDSRTRFLAAAAHDLGQPLQAARLFFEQAVRAPTAEARSTAAAHARNAFFGMEELLHAMLDHLRLSAGPVKVVAEALPLMPLIAACVARYGAVAADQGVRLVALPTRSAVRGDRALIERALGNLIDNALRHANATRVLIGAWRRPSGIVRLFVVDDGCGLAGQDVEALFGDFVQSEDRRGMSRGGFGIGLGSTRRAAQAMGGSAGHDSAWHAGALFYLDLPAEASHTPRQWD